MSTRLLLVLAALAWTAVPAAAQDAKAMLQAVSTAMGADHVKTVRITGTGIRAVFGQSYTSEEVQDWDWPRFPITSYTRSLDFDAQFSSEDITFRPATAAELGTLPKEFGRLRGGPTVTGEQRLVQIVRGNYAWNVQGADAVPVPAESEARQLQLILTPIGFLRAAMAGNPKAVSWTPNGKTLTVILSTDPAGTSSVRLRMTSIKIKSTGRSACATDYK